ncbi:qcr9 subunit 9 of the ubiquinol cytochrome-c reductase complex [Aspergillus alliaceus]|uniref:Complex III subunit 9 n=1 Tax=Petromyces alliaceus TaxID=209559 RepID=A0A8H6A7V3_PETAA|nr:qcr9 subunit 9 of the ubiquinol cytochrome-c reductase complex [Aspergillus burnettii]
MAGAGPVPPERCLPLGHLRQCLRFRDVRVDPTAFDSGSNRIWDTMNSGRQWKDIKHKFLVKEEDDE